MKKVLLGGLLTLLFSVSYAQIGDFFQDVRFGAKAGVNYSRISNIHGDSKGRIGFNAGGLALIPISYGNDFFIQPELFYSQKGETNDTKDGKEVYQLDYIDLPILFKAYFSDSNSEFFGIFGPQFSFLINNKIKNPSNIENIVSSYHNDEYKSFDFGLVGGIGYSYERNIELTLRAEYGLTDAVKGSQVESTKKNNNGVVSLGLSYIF
ncbi:PorT family protein [Weeksellaceae bacterium TAE3-ERU29]|nr:PorT family protein [Weeksellaceae bacterium TAE3-ERU29]